MLTIKCRVCLQDKLEESFSYKNKSLALRHTQCKACNKIYCTEHYHRNAKTYKERAIQNSVPRRAELHRRLHEYLASHPCVDCGETDPLVLELDHRHPSEKLYNLSRMWYNGYAWEKIVNEIGKCDVRCANCHRRRTALQQNWSNTFWATIK